MEAKDKQAVKELILAMADPEENNFMDMIREYKNLTFEGLMESKNAVVEMLSEAGMLRTIVNRCCNDFEKVVAIEMGHRYCHWCGKYISRNYEIKEKSNG